MTAFALRRLFHTIIILFIVSFVAFLLIHLTPGDPAILMLGENATDQEINALRSELWLDRPLVLQYGYWLSNFIQGDFGRSIMYRIPVSTLIAKAFPITFYIGVLSLILLNLVGIPAGIVCAVRRGTFLDSVISIFANLGIAIPIFWMAIIGVYTFGLELGWLPIHGFTSPFEDLWLSTKKLIMPVFCMAAVGTASIARQTRSAMLEVIKQDYIRTAWSKGLHELRIIWRHVLKNGLIPVVTLEGTVLVRLAVGGSVLVETVFNIPGMGRMIVTAAFNKDFIVLQACIMVVAIVVAVVNFVVDIIYGWLDPRIRYD